MIVGDVDRSSEMTDWEVLRGTAFERWVRRIYVCALSQR